MRRYAQIDGEYRYWLERNWSDESPSPGPLGKLTFVMLNPSTADAELDDATTVRCINFAIREGCWSMDIANLFALRARNPERLREHPDPIGVGNDAILRSIAGHRSTFRTVVAWGANKMVTPERVAILTDAARERGTTLWCLGMTKDGHPRHPLYLKAEQPLIPWFPRDANPDQ